jgi:hypothetical protein
MVKTRGLRIKPEPKPGPKPRPKEQLRQRVVEVRLNEREVQVLDELAVIEARKPGELLRELFRSEATKRGFSFGDVEAAKAS